MKNRIGKHLQELALLPGLSGHEQRVSAYMEQEFRSLGLDVLTDTLGNCMACIAGSDPKAPVIMVFSHMDSLGFLVKYIEEDGFLRLERLGGIPEKVLPSTPVQIMAKNGQTFEGVIGVKAHHVTPPEEKYVVDKYQKLYVDIGARSREEVLELGIDIGSPVVYKPHFQKLLNDRAYLSSSDNRSGCAVILELAHEILQKNVPCTVWLAGTVQEEYNLRGAMVASRTIRPDIAICLDGGGSTDTPDLKGSGLICVGKGPTMDLYNFHGRGTLNGTIAHPAMVRLAEKTADALGMQLQRSVHIGGLTDLSYVQLEGTGVKCLDLGYPGRYAHSPNELVDLNDLEALCRLTAALIGSINAQTDFSR